MTRTAKKWSARDTAACIITPSDLDHKYSRSVLGLITGSAQYPGAADTLGVTVLLKGTTTFVANDEVLIQLPVATPWLATAGSGDVLAGIMWC